MVFGSPSCPLTAVEVEGEAGAPMAAVSWMPLQLQAEEESQPAQACTYLQTREMPSVLPFT